MSRILENVRRSALRLHGAGYMDDAAMREFDVICRPPKGDAAVPGQTPGFRRDSRARFG